MGTALDGCRSLFRVLGEYEFHLPPCLALSGLRYRLVQPRHALRQFIQEQVAGDLLPTEDVDQKQKNLIATGFLAMGIKRLGERNPRTFTMDMVDEQIDTMSRAVLGMTVACARCHDHKFDPIPTTDYYSLAGIFLSTNTMYGTVFGTQNHRPADLIVLPKADEQLLGQEYTQEQIQGMRDRAKSIKTEMNEIRLAARKKGERPIQRQMVAMRNQIAKLDGILGTLDENGKPRTYAMGARDGDEPADTNVLLRGDVEMQAQKVKRGFLQVLSDVPAAKIASNSSGRRELAKWLTAKENPLTARVMVDRIWLHLFGEALQRSPNNWGTSAVQPKQAELLDHLAVRFMENNWSTKSLIREIVLSKAYQRSSKFDEKNYDADPDNELLW